MPSGRLAAPILVAAVIALAGAALWFVKVRQRASGATVQSKVVQQYPGAAGVSCVKLQLDGASWACGVVYKAESECVIANVSLFGSLSTNVGSGRCQRESSVAALLPTPAADSVAADVARITSTPPSTVHCVAVPGTKRRWACAVGTTAAPGCRFVRVVPWTPWRLVPGGQRCAKLPALRRLARA
jgi:hypothetical protein